MLVLWSGGCDSTLVLNNLLVQEQVLSTYQQQIIRTISINHPQITTSKTQKKTRDKLVKEFKNRGLEFDRNEVVIKHDYGAKKNHGIIQPFVWLFAAFQYLLEKEDLYTGYIRSDCIWRHKEKILSIFNDSQKIMWKSGSLMSPLEWMEKNEVLSRLGKANLLDLVWYCEDSNKKHCGKCTPCKTHLTAKWQISQGWTKTY